jgi:DNA modification methylase
MEINKVYLGDCIEVMKTLPNKSIDLIFADPPFNIGTPTIPFTHLPAPYPAHNGVLQWAVRRSSC